jgi:hypothetical protein
VGTSQGERQRHPPTLLTRANTLPADVTSKPGIIKKSPCLLVGGEGGILI